MTFGAALKEQRLRKKMKAPELAERTGWSKVQIHRIEASESISERTLRRYLAGLGLALDEDKPLRVARAPDG